uniref:Putative odorant binding protein n=1 Tax=Triatoma infestans TaxID=30076 RepID=A0A023F8B9_TRIIF
MFGLYYNFLFLTSAAVITALSPQQISSYSEHCKRSSPKFNKCMKNALQLFVNDLNKDVIDGETFDPWVMPELPLIYDAGASDKMSVTLLGVSLHGLSNLVIKNVRSNLKDKTKLRMEIDLFNNLMYFNGNYSAELTSNTEVPVAAEGTFNITLVDLKGTLILKGRTVKRNNVDYLQIDRASIKPELGNLYIDVVGENDPYPELTALVMSLVNQYWRLVYFEALPIIEEGLDEIIRSYVDQALSNIPFDIIVPA